MKEKIFVRSVYLFYRKEMTIKEAKSVLNKRELSVNLVLTKKADGKKDMNLVFTI